MVLFVFHYSDTVRHLVLVYQFRFKGLCCSKINNKPLKLKAPALKKKSKKKKQQLWIQQQQKLCCSKINNKSLNWNLWPCPSKKSNNLGFNKKSYGEKWGILSGQESLILSFCFMMQSFIHFCILQCGTADTEIKVPSVEKTGLWKVLLLKPGVGQNTALHTLPTARNFLPCSNSNFCFPGPSIFLFLQIFSWLFSFLS